MAMVTSHIMRQVFNPHLSFRSGVRFQSRTLSSWDSIKDYFSPKLEVHDLKLFDGSNSDSILISTHNDSEYGGGSNCQHDFLNGESNKFIRFSGNLIFNDHHAAVSKAKGGFCAMQLKYRKIVDLRDYDGLALELRCVKRQTFFFNFKCDTYLEGDMFQLLLDIEGGAWRTVYAPFHMFQLTSMGHVKDENMVNDSLQLEAFGVLVNRTSSGQQERGKITSYYHS